MRSRYHSLVYNRGFKPGVLVPLGGTRLDVKWYEDHWPQSSILNGFVEEFTFVLKKRLSRLKKYAGKYEKCF